MPPANVGILGERTHGQDVRTNNGIHKNKIKAKSYFL